jgi:hypothetical protein
MTGSRPRRYLHVTPHALHFMSHRTHLRHVHGVSVLALGRHVQQALAGIYAGVGVGLETTTTHR